MSVLIDISHPAHVHFFLPVAQALIADGISVHIVARDKDVTRRLLEASELPFEVLPMSRAGGGRLAAAAELLHRSLALRRRIRRLRVNVLLTRNPSGTIAAFGTPATSVFDTDDGRSVGAHYWLARPFADVITSSIHDPEQHGRHHRRYRALKAQMFLHPNRFSPDAKIQCRYLASDERYCVVRFSAHDASHDRRIRGITPEGRRAILERLKRFGPVVVSIEAEELRLERGAGEGIPVAPEHFHQLLANACVFVGDSQSVAAEAAVLGIPTLRLSGFTHKTFYLAYLEGAGLIHNFSPGEEADLLAELERHLDAPASARQRSAAAAAELNDSAEDLTRWFTALVGEITGRDRGGPRIRQQD